MKGTDKNLLEFAGQAFSFEEWEQRLSRHAFLQKTLIVPKLQRYQEKQIHD